MKKVLLSIFFSSALLLVGLYQISNAQNLTQETKDTNIYVGNVYVKDLDLGKSTFSPESMVTGTFNLFNDTNNDLKDVFYSVRLGEGDSENSAVLLEQGKKIGPIEIKKGETKQVSFSYKLSSYVSGKKLLFGIDSWNYSGLPYGWKSVPITVTGENESIVFTNLSVSVNGQLFDYGKGPTIKSGDKSFVDVVVSSNFSEDKTVTPVLTVQKWGNEYNIPTESKLNNIVIPAKSKAAKFEFPINLSGTPGVYEASIILIDKNGAKISSSAPYRYIEYGPIATIHSVAPQSNTLEEGSDFKIKLEWSGTPLDIVGGVSSSIFINPTAKVEITDVNGGILGKAERVLTKEGFEEISVPILKIASEYKIKIDLVNEGKTLATYSNSYVSESKIPTYPYVKYLIYGVGALLLALLVILIKSKRSKKVNVVSSAMILFILAGVSIANAYIQTGTAQYLATNAIRAGMNLVPAVTINSPVGNVLYNEEINFSGSVVAQACLNSWTILDLYYSVDDNSLNRSTRFSATNSSLAHVISYRNGSFSVNLAAASTLSPGNHRVYFKIINSMLYPGLNSWGQVTGYQDFTVVCPAGKVAQGGTCVDSSNPVTTAPQDCSTGIPCQSGQSCQAGLCRPITSTIPTVVWDGVELTGSSGPDSPACFNGSDDDGDGLTDMNDPGCSDPNDSSEFDSLSFQGSKADKNIWSSNLVLAKNTNADLKWNADGYKECKASSTGGAPAGMWTDSKEVGSHMQSGIGPISSSANFNLTCGNGFAWVPKQVKVIVENFSEY